MRLREQVFDINNKNDLVLFINSLRNDFSNNFGEWQNDNLADYLEAMQAWLEDIEGWERNCSIDISKINVWQLFGHILLASKMYQ